MAKTFEDEHEKLYPKSDKPIVYSIFDFGLSDKISFTSSESASKLGDMINNIRHAKVFLFDVFSQYADNKSVQRLLKDCAFSHHFVMLG